MTGWIGDCLRFYWALFYWNSRKTWFRLRGAQRDDCPCQTYGDSGQAFDSRCEAVTHWHRPERFRKVCPLLVETPQGWRCSVNAESVRPFWGRAVVHGLLLIVGLYLAATVAVFAALRLAHYETSYLMVAWPPRWSELRLAQEKLYANRAQQALRNGNYAEAILSLEMVTQLNPRNYPAGLALAGLNQLAGQPTVADHIYERLLRDAPDQRRQTAQIWFRNLLARAAYPEMKGLAVLMLNEDPAERAAWLNALLFACRQTADAGYLGMVLAENPNLADWCTELIGTEQMLLQNQIDRALPRLTRVPRSGANGYIPYYQVDRLLRHGDPSRAADMLRACEGLLPPDDAVILRLRVYQAQGWSALVNSEFDLLLQRELTPRIVAQVCAWLIAQPDSKRSRQFLARFTAANLPLEAETMTLHHAAYLVAANSAPEQADLLAARIGRLTASNARALRGLGELLLKPGPDARVARVLPLVPLPTEVVYAIVERKSSPPSVQ
ncbi:MAG TPA: tetratricopeptide repeat protein [Lacunisphaera sp.]